MRSSYFEKKKLKEGIHRRNPLDLSHSLKWIKTLALTHLTVRQNCDWVPLLHHNPRWFATAQILWVFLAFPFSFSSLLPSLLNSQHRLDYQQQWPKRHWEECLKNVKEYIVQTQRLSVYGLVTTEIELASLVYKSLNCSGFVLLFFLKRQEKSLSHVAIAAKLFLDLNKTWPC